MTPKTMKSSGNPTNRAHIERGFCGPVLWVLCLHPSGTLLFQIAERCMRVTGHSLQRPELPDNNRPFTRPYVNAVRTRAVDTTERQYGSWVERFTSTSVYTPGMMFPNDEVSSHRRSAGDHPPTDPVTSSALQFGRTLLETPVPLGVRRAVVRGNRAVGKALLQ